MNTTSLNGLPDRISALVQRLGYDALRCHGGLKTAFKPNATIPILWAVLLDDGLLLCSTHKTRGVYRLLRAKDLNSIRVSGHFLEIIPSGLDEIVRLPISPNDVDDFRKLAGVAQEKLCSGTSGFA